MTFSEFFAIRLPDKHFPYPYQERVAASLLAGKCVVLQAPTGAGKTWAAIAPFLYSRQLLNPIADRLIYALPLRSLASNLHESTSRAKDAGTKISLQIGGDANDPFFESDIVFTTIDQLLSSYLLHPVGLSPRLDNINAGALPGALIVLDEIHLLDPAAALGSAIEMLHTLKGFSQFVLMTATLSTPAAEWLAQCLGAELIGLPSDEIAALPAQNGRVRTWNYRQETLSAARILDGNQDRRTIVLTNTVSQAQRIYREIRLLLPAGARPLFLLHSRFLPADRKETEAELNTHFGPGALSSNAILVTTQVIEAGVDISAEELHTEIAPLNALIQRAGRVARYTSRNQGAVYVYEASSKFPYQLPELDLQAIRETITSPSSEDSWIDRVYGGRERLDLANRYTNLTPRRNATREAMEDGGRGCLSALVRSIDSVSIVITAHPDPAIFNTGNWPQTLSIPVNSLGPLAPLFQTSPADTPWIAQKLTSDPEDSESREPKVRWEPIFSFAEARSQWLLALHPNVANYTKELGLLLGEPGLTLPLTSVPRAPRISYQYTAEEWTVHSKRVMDQAESMAAGYNVIAKRLAAYFPLERIVQTACACHDAGKLTNEWQQVAWDWQSIKVPGCVRNVAIAHTTWQPTDPRTKFPPHAVEGAFLVAPAICAAFERLAAQVIVSAIARHHGPRSRNLTRFTPSFGFSATLGTVLSIPVLPPIQVSEINRLEFQDFLINFANNCEPRVWALYVTTVRRLRLADQTATANANA